MSNTRYAREGAPLSQSRYMSSPEYAELRGLSGSAVTAKACYLQRRDQKALLYFIQALSLKDGGLPKLARDILSAYPERIGTPEMHKAGMNKGRVYPADLVSKIKQQLSGYLALQYNPSLGEEETGEERCQPAMGMISLCRLAAERHLDSFLMDLCINPRREVDTEEGEYSRISGIDRKAVQDRYPEVTSRDFGWATVPYFQGILEALYDFMGRYARQSAQAIAETSISSPVFATLDKCLETRKMVVIQGNSRIGKSTAAEAWCNMHLGEARYVSLSGIMNRTVFFRTVSRALGLASSGSQKSAEMQLRVEDMLQRSKLMLVIDEAHYLFPQHRRVYTAPELVDWVNTALCNQKVPVGLVCTPQMAYRRMEVEKQTGWNSEQFRGRITEYRRLQDVPSQSDLEAVARKHLPGVNKATIQMIIGYAMASKGYMPAVVDTIDEARILARKEGRDCIRFEDVDTAISQYRVPSDTAQANAFEAPAGKPGRKRARLSPERECLPADPEPALSSPPRESLCSPAATRLQDDLTEPEEAPAAPSRNRLDTLPGRLAPLPAARPPSPPAISDPERPRIAQEAVLQD